MNIREYIIDEISCLKERKEIFYLAKQTGNNPAKEFNSFRRFVHSRADVYHIIKKLSKPNENNQAISIFSSILGGVMMVTSSNNVDYSWRTLFFMQQICQEIMDKEGTPSDQFAVMAATSIHNSDGSPEKEEEE